MKTLHTLQPSYYCTCHVCTYMYRIKYKLRRQMTVAVWKTQQNSPPHKSSYFSGHGHYDSITINSNPFQCLFFYILISSLFKVQGSTCRNLMRLVLVDRKENTKNVVDPKDCLQKNLVIYHRRGRT